MVVSISAYGKVIRFLGNGVILADWAVECKSIRLVYSELLKYFFGTEL